MNQNVGDQKNLEGGQLTAQQRRFWVLEQLEGNAGSHNIPLCLRLRGKLDLACLDEATRSVSNRHDVMLFCFVMDGDEPRSYPCRLPYQALTPFDLTSLSEDERTRTANTKMSDEIQRPFDLQTGPLFRSALYRLAPEDHIYLLTFHRIICDAGSAQGSLSTDWNYLRMVPVPLILVFAMRSKEY